MELRLRAKNLELDDKARSFVDRKVNRIGRHLPSITTATVELSLESTKSQNTRAVAQITLDINGTILRGEERDANVMAALNAVVDVMDHRVQRYKGRVYKSLQAKKTGKNVSIRTPEPVVAPEDDDSEETQIAGGMGRLVRVKSFPIKPMTVDEAAFNMELLGHSFFLFFNSETNQHSVLYLRRDGDYGLILPEPL